jgi:hypothetical protein
MTVEQRIARLDKRIAIFEQYLLLQHDTLCLKYSKNDNPFFKVKKHLSARQRIMQAKLIALQPIAKFPKGGEIKNPC